MSSSTPQLFTVTFWQVTAAQVVVGAASAVVGPAAATLAALATNNGHGVSVPWWLLLISAAVGALVALCHAVVGSQLPGTGPASLLPAPKATRATPRRPRRRKPTPQAPTTKDLRGH